MKYKRWYTNIIAKRLNNLLTTEEYGEWHHIIPRSLGGEDVDENMVRLTAREHFICHWLLVKMTDGEDREKMVYALRLMRANNEYQQRYETKITARVYERLREEFSRIHSKNMAGDNNPAKRPEVGRAISESKIGVKRAPFSQEWLANLKATRQGERNGMYGKQHSEETREILRQQKLGRKHSEETKQKIAKGAEGRKKPLIHCVHCGRDIASNGYARFHGDKCKMKPQ